jgi:2-polyprenyl-6-methoxyphenol hydroxylase-like FAD-dependent oxidoreductase
LIEQASDAFRGSRGKGIQPRTQEIFEDLEVLDRVVAVGGLYPPQREYREDGSHVDSLVIEHEAATPAEPYHLPLMVPQFLTEAVLRARLSELGQRPEFGCELMAFEQDGEWLTARLASNARVETIRVRYLVGADGGRSFVRHALKLDFPGKTLGVRAVVADIELTGLSRDVWHRFGEGSMQRQLALCPLAGTALFQLQAPVPLEGDSDVSAAGLQAMVRERTGRDDLCITAVSWASVYQMNARLADRYRVGRVFLTGDAAHVHPPTGGQGLNTSVQDAYNLGWKLAAVLRGAPDALLDSYEAERRPIAAAMLGLSTKLLDAAKSGEMRRGRDVKQLDLAYTDSVLTWEQPRRNRVRSAGERAPDAPLRGAAGQTRRLFDVLRGPHWTVLAYEPPDRVSLPARAGLHIHRIASDGDLRDPDQHFRNAYGVSPGDWLAIRPDGYIGAIVTSEHVGELARYLSSCGHTD